MRGDGRWEMLICVVNRYPKICYTTEGEEMKERLWKETMEELDFAGAEKIIKSLKV
jgi:hypothetical protein